MTSNCSNRAPERNPKNKPPAKLEAVILYKSKHVREELRLRNKRSPYTCLVENRGFEPLTF